MRYFTAIFYVLGLAIESEACFENSAALVKNSFGKYVGLKTLEYSPAINNFCKETEYKENFKKLAANEFLTGKAHPKLKMLLAAQSPEFKTQYQEQLDKIKKIEPLDERLKATYSVALRLFGFLEYDRKKFSAEPEFENIKTPNNLKNEFLAFLLLQAKKSEDEFKVNILESFPGDSLKLRKWVRVEIPDKENQKLDLDPSVTGLEYLPLPLRHTGINETEVIVLQEECANVMKCLLGSIKREKEGK